MATTAQISLYPLKEDYVPPIRAVINVLRTHGVQVTVGAMSTVISGDSSEVFRAVEAAYRYASEDGLFVLVVTYTNARPEQGS